MLAGKHRIVGHPVCIASPRYARNEFIFNFVFVLPASSDPAPAARVARCVAALLREAEEADGLLSADEEALALGSVTRPATAAGESSTGRSRVAAFAEMLMQDLNAYGEASLPLGDPSRGRVLNATLRANLPPAPHVRAWHVPVPTRPLRKLAGVGNGNDDYADTAAPGWDLALAALAREIDGKRTVAAIAHAADADDFVAQRGIANLAQAGLVRLIDAFQYGAAYAAAPEVRRVLLDRHAAARAAVAAGLDERQGPRVAALYASFGTGAWPSVGAWAAERTKELEGVDIRRLVTWGVLQGLLYRLHRYAIADGVGHAASMPQDNTSARGTGGSSKAEMPLDRYLDGRHCFDAVCTAHQIGPSDLTTRLHEAYKVHIIEK